MPSRELPAPPEPRTTEEAGQVPARRGEGARPGRAPAIRRSARVLEQVPRRDRRARSGAARRAVGDRARARIPVVDTRCAKKSSRARCRSTRRSTSSSAAPPAARPAARSGCSRSIRDSPRPRCRRRWSSATPRPWRSGCDDHPELATAAGRTAELGAAALRVPHVACTTAIRPALEGLVAIARRLCALGANPNAEYHWNWHPELPRTALVGSGLRRRTPAACGSPARGRREPDRRRHRRTLPAAAAISQRSNCCTATAST